MKYKIACPSFSVEWHLPYYSAVARFIFILTLWICLDLQYLLNCLDLTCSIYFSIWPFIAFFPLHFTFSLTCLLPDYVQLLLLIRTHTGRLSPVLLSILSIQIVQSPPAAALVLLYFQARYKVVTRANHQTPHTSSENFFEQLFETTYRHLKAALYDPLSMSCFTVIFLPAF